ncbi:hypothetical protein Pmani_036396 [Petrolisthes manimaculis]|uniref:Uncharacterized protein n=1 Tax=Petrolisthes manimaculis TaxID=1843537 RepID=A0AAE1NK91_9EUCA|nr:hypothetical protein Pmani_036396 [Petrolisthes manimaculis]
MLNSDLVNSSPGSRECKARCPTRHNTHCMLNLSGWRQAVKSERGGEVWAEFRRATHCLFTCFPTPPQPTAHPPVSTATLSNPKPSPTNKLYTIQPSLPTFLTSTNTLHHSHSPQPPNLPVNHLHRQPPPSTTNQPANPHTPDINSSHTLHPTLPASTSRFETSDPTNDMRQWGSKSCGGDF